MFTQPLRFLVRRAFVAFGAVMLTTSLASAAVVLGTVELSGDQEVTVSTTASVGHGEWSYNADSVRLMLVAEFTGIDLDGLQTPTTDADNLVGLHLHRGGAMENGPVVFDLLNDPGVLIDAANGRVLSIWDSTEGGSTALADEVPNLFDERLYLNAHTVEFPSGAIRGQLLLNPVPEPSTALLMANALIGMVFCRRRRN